MQRQKARKKLDEEPPRISSVFELADACAIVRVDIWLTYPRVHIRPEPV